MQELNSKHGAILVKLARSVIGEALGGPHTSLPANSPFADWRATFVTIYRGDILHGCMGSLEAHRSLAQDVTDNAVAAALRDPRAVPLVLADVDALAIEISVLSPLVRLSCADEAAAIAALLPDRDGVVLRYGQKQATFLPQVWKTLPNPHDFLRELRQKARMPPDFWHKDLEIYCYRVEKFVDAPSAAS